MARRTKHGQRALRHLATAILIGTLGLVGCSKPSAPPEAARQSAEPTSARSIASPSAVPADPPRDNPQSPPPDDEFHQSFTKAVRPADDPPPNVQVPPDRTISGKAVGKLYLNVVKIWDSIRFTDPQGRKIDYTATVETDLGSIEIALRPDVAPNHVRSFIALAKVGYFDGLYFDRIRSEKAEDDSAKVLDTIEAGCPLGTGEPGYGSIGYWLYPEIAKPEAKITHDEGAVGACHGPELDSAACRFYITLTPAPILDGNYTLFGKVSKGLDVARAIWKQPHIEEDGDADGSHRPVKPVAIRRVVIHEQAAGSSNVAAGGLQY
jgi:cyclophilin family peptidyl-prolyl cis-trans isomerase